jgi:hypothetical protein
MFNPFTEVAEDDSADSVLVEQAIGGDRAALEKLVLRHQAWVYNIAVRMVFRPQDAAIKPPLPTPPASERTRRWVTTAMLAWPAPQPAATPSRSLRWPTGRPGRSAP